MRRFVLPTFNSVEEVKCSFKKWWWIGSCFVSRISRTISNEFRNKKLPYGMRRYKQVRKSLELFVKFRIHHSILFSLPKHEHELNDEAQTFDIFNPLFNFSHQAKVYQIHICVIWTQFRVGKNSNFRYSKHNVFIRVMFRNERSLTGSKKLRERIDCPLIESRVFMLVHCGNCNLFG